MDGLEFLAELAPIYRVFPSLPFTLPPTSPNTHVIAWRKKTQTQIDIASAAIKPKINQKHMSQTDIYCRHRHTQHTHLQNQKHSNFSATLYVYIPTRCNLAGFRVYSNQV